MIERYQTPEMLELFSTENRFHYMLLVEQAVADVQADLQMIPKAAAVAIRKKAKIDVKKILRIEKTTKHDVIAFVSQVAESVGPLGRFVHYGLTSSDVLDTALSLQISDAFSILLKDLKNLHNVLSHLCEQHKATLCSGRTHGILAEPTTFGFKMAGHLAELNRAIAKIKLANAQFRIVKLSGAVGTSSALGYKFEEKVGLKLRLKPEDFATQVIPRDRHAEVMSSLAFLGCFFERLAVELRHLQRSEVNEVIEGFQAGQKGSSAMPHKKNPISAENITGLSRLLRSYLITSFENTALWHERDISHSSNERIMQPDAFTLAHYLTKRMTSLLSSLYINEKQMEKNLQIMGGAIFSSHVLLYLIDETGWSRERVYEIIQRHAHSLGPNEHLQEKLLNDPDLKGRISEKGLKSIFSGKVHKNRIEERFEVKFGQIKREGKMLWN